MARSTRLLRATTRRFRLILSGREACRANGCPGGVHKKALPRSARTPTQKSQNVLLICDKASLQKKVRICACAVRPTSCRSRARTPMRGLTFPASEDQNSRLSCTRMRRSRFVSSAQSIASHVLHFQSRSFVLAHPRLHNAKVCAQEPSRST